MKILRNKTFSDPDKKKKEREKKHDRELLKNTAVLSSIPIALTQATRLEDQVAKKKSKKELEGIKQQTEKLKKEVEEQAKDEVRKFEANLGVGKRSEQVGKLIDSIPGIKREKQPYMSEEDLENIRGFKKTMKNTAEEAKKGWENWGKRAMENERNILEEKLRGNKSIRKLGVGLAAVPAAMGAGIYAITKSQRRKRKEMKEKGGKKNEDTKN